MSAANESHNESLRSIFRSDRPLSEKYRSRGHDCGTEANPSFGEIMSQLSLAALYNEFENSIYSSRRGEV